MDPIRLLIITATITAMVAMPMDTDGLELITASLDIMARDQLMLMLMQLLIIMAITMAFIMVDMPSDTDGQERTTVSADTIEPNEIMNDVCT